MSSDDVFANRQDLCLCHPKHSEGFESAPHHSADEVIHTAQLWSTRCLARAQLISNWNTPVAKSSLRCRRLAVHILCRLIIFE